MAAYKGRGALGSLRSVIGEDGIRALILALPGREIYVPVYRGPGTYPPDHRLVAVLGMEKALALSRFNGGCFVEIPVSLAKVEKVLELRASCS